MIYFFILVICAYTILFTWLLYGFLSVKYFNSKEYINKTISFSIIVPFRNEEHHLPFLLTSFKKLDYPHSYFEILLINDESDDSSEQKVLEFISNNPEYNISLYNTKRISKSPKKDAITFAISKAKFNWIITTDADCEVPTLWLRTFSEFIYKERPKMIVAPVTFKNPITFLDNFQQLNLLSLQGATIGGFGVKNPFLCNGANLVYKKTVFKELKGFSENDSIASGDDIFFMESVLEAYPKDVMYLKSNNVIVVTKPQPNWSNLINQHTRWAAKATFYNNSLSKIIGVIVVLTNFTVVTFLLLSILNIFPLKILIIGLIIKYFIDYLIIRYTSSFFKDSSSLIYYLPSSLIYPFFTIFIVLRSFFIGFSWKDRVYKK